MFSTCPSVRLFVCYQIVNTVFCNERTNFDANLLKWVMGQVLETVNFLGQEFRGQDHMRLTYVTTIPFDEISRELFDKFSPILSSTYYGKCTVKTGMQKLRYITRLKLDLEAWQRYHSQLNSVGWSSFSSLIW